MLIGSIDTVRARGMIAGDSLLVAGNRVLRASASYDVSALPERCARHDRRTCGLARDRDRRHRQRAGAAHARESLARELSHSSAASNRRTGSFVAGSHLTFDRSLDSLRLAIDSLGGLIETHQWGLLAPATSSSTPAGTRLDSLVARSGEGGTFMVHADLPNSRPST